MEQVKAQFSRLTDGKACAPDTNFNNVDGAYARENFMTTLVKPVHSEQNFVSGGDRNIAVAVYLTHTEAEEAVKELERSGFDMTKLSIAGKDYETDEHVVGFYNTGDRMKSWGKTGAFWGGLWGFMFGAFFVVPGVGPILVAGPLVAWIVGALEGAVVVGGVSALGAGLVGAGLHKDSVLKYESDITAGRYVLLAHGSIDEINDAKAQLESTNHLGVTEHYETDPTL